MHAKDATPDRIQSHAKKAQADQVTSYPARRRLAFFDRRTLRTHSSYVVPGATVLSNLRRGVYMPAGCCDISARADRS
jgi:hypothetical protein